MEQMNKGKQGAKKLYDKLSEKRVNYLNRAEDASKLTIPQLYTGTYDGTDEGNSYGNPYQSLGARGVNNLANKIILTLFPPATAFFKMGVDPITLKAMGKGEGQINQALQVLEKSIVNEMEISQLRSALVDSLKHGIVAGSVVLHVPETDSPKVYSLDSFAIKRSKSKKILKLIIKECMMYSEFDKDVQKQLVDSNKLKESQREGKDALDVYTVIKREDDGMYSVHQDILDMEIDGTQGRYKEGDLPYIFVPFVDRGESYGRSYLEDYIGDLNSYEGLRQSVLEAAAESARILYLIKPNATLTPKKLQSANSGDVIQGNPDDVGVLQADKRLDLQIAQAEMEILRLDLSTLFLLDSSVRRNAERVTAEEIRRVSQELEVALGGIYSTLANVLQEPLVNLYLNRLKKKGTINSALKDSIELEVTTGSAALGRGTEFNSITAFTQAAQAVLGDQFSSVVKMPELIARIANSLDIGTSELIKTEEEIQAEQVAAQEAQLQQQAVAPAISAAAQGQGQE
jgi:hypothetical protein